MGAENIKKINTVTIQFQLDLNIKHGPGSSAAEELCRMFHSEAVVVAVDGARGTSDW